MAKNFGIGDLASLGFGQVGQLFEGMDLMRKTWSAMSLPTAMSPTLSLEELDKRISDLRAIEQWLTLNQNMLRGTIQGLEVQRGTIATLQSFGQAIGTPGKAADGAGVDPRQLAAIIAALQQQNAPAGGVAPATNGTHAAGAASDAPPGPVDGSGASEPEAADAAGAASGAEAAQLAQTWWSMLQDQFQQVAGAALSGVGAGIDAVSRARHAGLDPEAEPAPAPAAAPKAAARKATPPGTAARSGRKTAAARPRKRSPKPAA